MMNENIRLDLQPGKVKGHVAVQLFKNGKETLKAEVHNTFSPLSYSIFSYFYKIINGYIQDCCKGNYYSGGHDFNPRYLQLMDLADDAISITPNKQFFKYTPLAWADLWSTYSGSDTTRGTINQADSNMQSVDGSHIKFHIVVDFPTSAANGTFNAIKLINNGYRDDNTGLLSGTTTITRSPYTAKYTGTFCGLFTYFPVNNIWGAAFNHDLDSYYKILESDNQTIVAIINDTDYKCRVLKYNFIGDSTPTVIGETKKSDGTTAIDVSGSPFIEDSTNYIIFKQDNDNSRIDIIKVNKTTLVADTDGTTYATTLPYSNFKQNNLDFNITAKGCCNQSGEFYITGYTHDTAYHNYLLILDKTGAITSTILLGDSTDDFWSFEGISASKSYIYLGLNYKNELALVVDKASKALYCDCINTWDDSSNQSYQWDCTKTLSQNTDDVIRTTKIYDHNSTVRNYVHYPESYMNMAKLDTPVTKTSDNTMKVTYDITAEIPIPEYTA